MPHGKLHLFLGIFISFSLTYSAECHIIAEIAHATRWQLTQQTIRPVEIGVVRELAENVRVDLALMEQTDLKRSFESETIRKYGGHLVTDRKRMLDSPSRRPGPLWTVAGCDVN